MKIIFITYDLPYPLSSGGKIRAFQMLKALSARYEITLYSYVRTDPDPGHLTELRKYCREIRLYQRQKVWSLGHFLRAGFSALPGTIAHYVCPKLKQDLLTELTTGGYLAVHFESYYSSLYLPEVKALGINTILGTENIEYDLYRKFVLSLPFIALPLKAFLYFDLGKMRRFEENSWRLADSVLAVSEEEAAVISKAAGREVQVVANGVDIRQFAAVARKASGPPTVIFVGNLKYLQNDRGIKKFLSVTLPIIRKECPDLVVKIVSSHRPAWINDYLSGIELIIDSQTPFSEFAPRADVLINPVEVKGGTRIKLLEGLAAGLPVVTYSSSLSGFDRLVPGRDLLVAETPESFAASVVRLLGDAALRDKIGAGGREVAVGNYSWDKSMARLLNIYQKLIIDE
ncbi:MAG: glycosyltransferase family 4 protein [Patescibacteria group bacterium]